MTPAQDRPARLAGVTVVVLAAGAGSRMHSAQPKVLHPLLGRPMALWTLDAARLAGVASSVVVLSPATEALRAELPAETLVAVQAEPRGTGDAVRNALAVLPRGVTELVIACGDTPLLTPADILGVIEARAATNGPLALAAFVANDPTGYGRVACNDEGQALSVVEERDATEEERELDLVNAGLYAVDRAWLDQQITALAPSAASGEIYLTDLVAAAARAGTPAGLYVGDASELEGVNDRRQFADAAAGLRERINDAHMAAGVLILDPTTAWIEPSVTIAPDAVIEPGVALSGTTTIGARSRIGSHSSIIDSLIGADCVITASTVEGSTLHDTVDVGPYAHVRPGCEIESKVHIGNFAELKSACVRAGAKVGHHSYLGDVEIGAGANIGAGTITANYDGKEKHATVIGEGVFTGVGTLLVAPVVMGAGSKSGAGAVITTDVKPGDLVVGVPARSLSKAE